MTDPLTDDEVAIAAAIVLYGEPVEGLDTGPLTHVSGYDADRLVAMLRDANLLRSPDRELAAVAEHGRLLGLADREHAKFMGAYAQVDVWRPIIHAVECRDWIGAEQLVKALQKGIDG